MPLPRALPRLLSPLTEPNAWIAAAGAVTAAVTMAVNAAHHHGVIDATVITAAVTAVAALFSRQLVTPVRDPRGSDGVQLVPVTSPLAPGLPGGRPVNPAPGDSVPPP